MWTNKKNKSLLIKITNELVLVNTLTGEEVMNYMNIMEKSYLDYELPNMLDV